MRLRPTRAPIVFDWWLTGICVSRIFNGLVFMTYAAALPILQKQWAMSATQAGSIAGGFQLGYAVSLVLFSSLADRISARTVYIHSLFASGVCGLAFAFLALITLRHTVISVPERRKGQTFTREVLGNRKAMLLIWGYLFHNWELQGLWAWTPAFLAACLEAAGAAGVKAVAAGANIVALFHLMGLLASFSMGILSDRFGRARVMVMLAAVSMFCSFSFGWTIGSPLVMIVGVGVLYAFSSLGDSPILSAALTEEKVSQRATGLR